MITKPCPFCGNRDVTVNVELFAPEHATCGFCGARGPMVVSGGPGSQRSDRAIMKWNIRIGETDGHTDDGPNIKVSGRAENGAGSGASP